jgi:hypothetical protein
MYFKTGPAPHAIVRLSANGQFTTVLNTSHAVAVDAAGTVYATGYMKRTEVTVLSGEARRTVKADPVLAYISHMRATGDGRFWANGIGGVAFWDGSSWTVVKRSRFHEDIQNLAVDSAGTLWALTESSLLQNTRAGFKVVALPAVEGSRLFRFVSAPDGGLGLVHERGLLREVDGGWTPALERPTWSAVFRPDGAVVAAALDESVVFVVEPGGATRSVDLNELGIPVEGILDVATDGQGRVWVNTEAGLVVLDGELSGIARWWARGSTPLLEGGIWDMFAVGDGPSLPEAGPVYGHVKGRAVRRGAPLVGVVIEMCDHPNADDIDPDRGETPCSNVGGVAYSEETKTRRDGRFDFWVVPAGDFGIAFDLGRSRWDVRENACHNVWRPDEVVDLGDIDVPAP